MLQIWLRMKKIVLVTDIDQRFPDFSHCFQGLIQFYVQMKWDEQQLLHRSVSLHEILALDYALAAPEAYAS